MATITQISNGKSLAGVSGTKVATTSSTGTSTTTTAASDKAKELKNQFLSILLTQMQHQNPLDPMDTKEFTGQLTQFSALEQQIDTNSNLEKMLGALNQSSLSSAFGYIGQTVDVATASTAVQDKSVNWTYAIPADAKSVGISVTDSTGKIVYSGAMQNSAGGSSINAGTYSLNLKDADLTRATVDGEILKVAITLKDSAGKTMKDSAGKDITADIHTAVKVDSVQSDSTGTFLQAGSMLFQISDVNKIIKPAATTTTTTSDTATDTTNTTNTETTT